VGRDVSFDHSGRPAFVTGAGSGIGRATAIRLASEGSPVAVVDVNLEAAEETAKAIAGQHQTPHRNIGTNSSG